jgi:hypothetical protein
MHPFYKEPSKVTISTTNETIPDFNPTISESMGERRPKKSSVPTAPKEQWRRITIRKESPKPFYVFGQSPRAMYMAHALAGASDMPPPQILSNDPNLKTAWMRESRSVTISRPFSSDQREVPQPEFVGLRQKYAGEANDEPIQNLILDLPGRKVIQAIERVRHRIDEYTTILLTQDGLGIDEYLNERIFTDPVTRPTYILGQMTQVLMRGTGAEKKRKADRPVVANDSDVASGDSKKKQRNPKDRSSTST